jgi:hypothetical protein
MDRAAAPLAHRHYPNVPTGPDTSRPHPRFWRALFEICAEEALVEAL